MPIRIKYCLLWLLGCMPGAWTFAQDDFSGLMPGKKDYILKFWKDGFVNPQHQPLLQVYTGWYGFSLDVMQFRFLHFNRQPGIHNALPDPAVINGVIGKGEPASLAISFVSRGKKYEMVPLTGAIDSAVKLLEDGTWLVRHVWPQLVFKNKEEQWPGVAGLELSAWPGRFVLALKIKPSSAGSTGQADIAIETNGMRLNGKAVTQAHDGNIIVTTDVVVDNKTAPASQVKLLAQRDGATLPSAWEPATGRWVVKMPAVTEVPDTLADPYPAMLDYRENIAFAIENTTADTAVIPVTIEKMLQSRLSGIDIKKALPIIGLCFVVYDSAGLLTGLPVQVSKNWHATGRIDEYETNWYRGSFMLRVPPASSAGFTVQIIRGRWAGLAASTLAQLCLIGWPGRYSLDWHQVAIGNFGESITYSPEGLLGNALICDWRPLYITGQKGKQYDWTGNLGGGDWLVYYDEQGERQRVKEVMTGFASYGPLLSEISYTGMTSDKKIKARMSAVTFAGNDLNRTVFHIRYDVLENTDVNRLAFFQMGADSYNWHKAAAITGGTKEGKSFTIPVEVKDLPQGSYTGAPIPAAGLPAWVGFTGSYPERKMDLENGWTWANRGFIIRSWKAVLNGHASGIPYINSNVTVSANVKSNNAELVLPPEVKQLQKGDYIEFCAEGIIVPKQRSDYYEKDSFLIAQLAAYPDSWQLFNAYAERNDVEALSGKEFIKSLHPVAVECKNDAAVITMKTAAERIPVRFTGLTGYKGYVIRVKQGTKECTTGSQSPDEIQTDFDPVSGTWSLVVFIKMHTPCSAATISIEKINESERAGAR